MESGPDISNIVTLAVIGAIGILGSTAFRNWVANHHVTSEAWLVIWVTCASMYLVYIGHEALFMLRNRTGSLYLAAFIVAGSLGVLGLRAFLSYLQPPTLSTATQPPTT